MKIFALTNDNHMLKGLPDHYYQLYAGELDIKKWGYLSALYEAIQERCSEDIVGVTVDGRLFDMQIEVKDATMESTIRLQLSEADMIAEPINTFKLERVSKQFARCHMPSCLFYAYEAIYTIYPQYEDAFFQIMDGRKLHLHNSFITKADIFGDYMKWLFDILFYVDRYVQSPDQDFILASLPERFLEIYIQHNDLIVKEIPCTKLNNS